MKTITRHTSKSINQSINQSIERSINQMKDRSASRCRFHFMRLALKNYKISLRLWFLYCGVHWFLSKSSDEILWNWSVSQTKKNPQKPLHHNQSINWRPLHVVKHWSNQPINKTILAANALTGSGGPILRPGIFVPDQPRSMGVTFIWRNFSIESRIL